VTSIIVYIAHPYSAPTLAEQIENAELAREIARRLWSEGIACINPIANAFGFDDVAPYEYFISGDIEILKRCDVLLLCGDSPGTRAEHKAALDNGKRIFTDLDDLIDWYATTDTTRVGQRWTAEEREYLQNLWVMHAPNLHTTARLYRTACGWRSVTAIKRCLQRMEKDPTDAELPASEPGQPSA